MAKISRKVKILIAIALIVALAVAVYFYLQQSELSTPLFDDIRWSPEIIRAGKPVTFNLTIIHTGLLPALGEVKVYVSKYRYVGFSEPTLAGSFKISLNPQSSASYTYVWTPPKAGFYRLKFVIEGGGSLTQLVYAAPQNQTASSFTFAVFGDNRPNGGIQPQPDVFKEIAREVRLIHPDFAVLTGDIIYGYRSDIPRLKMQWNDFLSVYYSSRVPIFVVPGNHEMKTEGYEDSGDPDAQILYIMNLGRLYYAFSYGNSFFILLDTDLVGEASTVKGKQLEWLKEMLRESKKYEHTFVFMHKPVVTSPSSDMLINPGKIAELLVEAGVRAVFQGHNHIYYHEKVGQTDFYVTGGAGAPLFASFEHGGVHHFLLVTVNGSNVNVQMVPLDYLDVKYGEDRVEISYSFTQKLEFSRNGYSWDAEPQPLTMEGLTFKVIEGEYGVEGGEINRVLEYKGETWIIVRTLVEPGESKVVKILQK